MKIFTSISGNFRCEYFSTIINFVENGIWNFCVFKWLLEFIWLMCIRSYVHMLLFWRTHHFFSFHFCGAAWYVHMHKYLLAFRFSHDSCWHCLMTLRRLYLHMYICMLTESYFVYVYLCMRKGGGVGPLFSLLNCLFVFAFVNHLPKRPKFRWNFLKLKIFKMNEEFS